MAKGKDNSEELSLVVWMTRILHIIRQKLLSSRYGRFPVMFAVAFILSWLYFSEGRSKYPVHMSNKLRGPSSYEYPFQDPSLAWDTRVDDLVSRLTLDEITAQMAHGGRTTYAPAIARLGIKPYPWGSECLRGDVAAGPATSFPQAIGLAATFSREVIFNVSRATGYEVRAKHNNYSSHGNYGVHTSASCWSPVINIARDPRWGRNEETYGEDPYLSGEMSMSYVTGLQGDDPRYVLANAGCKHYDAYGGPENIPISRHMFDAKVKEADLRNTFLQAFRKCVKAGTYSLMCSYNSVNGVPACASKKLLTDILRDEWGFKGYVISDEGAIEDILDNHKYVNTIEDAAAVAVLAGTNLEDGKSRRSPYFSAISSAVHQGKLNESTVREAVKPLFYTRMRLGLFDPPHMVKYSQLNVTDYVQIKPHRELAITSALRSLVLLKNDDKILPLSGTSQRKPLRKIAIVGPMADNKAGIFGGYPPEPDVRFVYTPRMGLSDLADHHSYHAGCAGSDPKCLHYDSEGLKEAIQGSDLVVVALGTGETIECENRDRDQIELPGKQMELLRDAVRFADEAPVVLLLFNGGPLDVTWAVTSPDVKVIIGCFYPAQGTGQALYRMFMNEDEASNPAGRIPQTWPASLNQVPAMTNYSMEERTYRYITSTPLFPFGYGLSYSRFEYISLSLEVKPALQLGDMIGVHVRLSNTGPYDGEEVIQLYVSWPNKELQSTPNLQLAGFGRYFIKSGREMTYSFEVVMEDISLWNDKEERFVLVPGEYTIYAGGQQPHQKTTVPSNVLEAKFTIHS